MFSQSLVLAPFVSPSSEEYVPTWPSYYPSSCSSMFLPGPVLKVLQTVKFCAPNICTIFSLSIVVAYFPMPEGRPDGLKVKIVLPIQHSVNSDSFTCIILTFSALNSVQYVIT